MKVFRARGGLSRSLFVVVLIAASIAAVAPTGAEQSAPRSAHRAGHKVSYPTVAGVAARRVARAAAAATTNLAYGGGVDGIGVTTGPPKVYLVFWGSQWGTATTTSGTTTFSNDPQAVAPRVQALRRDVGRHPPRVRAARGLDRDVRYGSLRPRIGMWLGHGAVRGGGTGEGGGLGSPRLVR